MIVTKATPAHRAQLVATALGTTCDASHYAHALRRCAQRRTLLSLSTLPEIISLMTPLLLFDILSRLAVEN